MLDRVESKTRLDEISELVQAGRNDEAVDMLDNVNWRKVQNVSSLLSASELYEATGHFQDARELLEIAHERSPIGRMIIFKLAIVSIRLGNLKDANEYYQEFLDVAPHDSLKYIINYELSRAREESDMTLIAILEELKDSDFSEDWAFELACLYHKTGQVEKCIGLCDEIILWFGDGIYVEKALELKMLYQPLDAEQEDKYRQMVSRNNGITEIRPQEPSGNGEILSHTIRIPEISLSSVEKFNTTNLQAEIKKNIEEIMQASEMGEVSDNMDAIKELVEDIPYLQVKDTKEQSKEAFKKGNTQNIGEIYNKYLYEEFDGQMSLYIPEEGSTGDDSMDGQMTIEDVMEQWEKTKRAAEATLSEAKEIELAEYKRMAVQEASRVLERLIATSAQLEAGVSPAQLMKDEYLAKGRTNHDFETMPLPTDEESTSQEKDTESVQSEAEDALMQSANEADKETLTEPESEAAEDNRAFEIPRLAAEGELREDTWKIPIISAKEAEEMLQQEVPTLQEVPVEDAETEDLQDWTPPALDQMISDVNDIMDEQKKENDQPNDLQSETEESMTTNVEEELPQVAPVSDEEDIRRELTNAEKEIFSYFIGVSGMETAICQVLTGVEDRLSRQTSSMSGNILIMGRRGSGKTRMATDLIKALQHSIGKPTGNVGKISGDKLNEKDIHQLFEKIRGGSLIVEGAGAMENETLVTLSLMMENDKSGILVLLEDSRVQLEKLLAKDGRFAKKFTEKIKIPDLTIDELVGFGKLYAKECNYGIDEMGILAMYDRINLTNRANHPTVINDVKEIVDDAIANHKSNKRKGVFKLFGSKNIEEDGMTILQERDFQDD